MDRFVAILDDEPDRVREMSRILGEHFPQFAVQAFDNAPDMNQWISHNLQSGALICLDHDLGPNRLRRGVSFDPGTGRDAANFIAEHSPSCPIIIHTTNTLARPGMMMVLEDAGWNVSYVAPYSDLLWIDEVWREAVAAVLR